MALTTRCPSQSVSRAGAGLFVAAVVAAGCTARVPEPSSGCVDTYLMERGSANPNALDLTALKSGYHECAEGSVVRAAAIACPINLAPGECLADIQCGADALCACPHGNRDNRDSFYGSPHPRCLPAGCRTNDDCPNRVCLNSAVCSDMDGFYCATAEDECASRVDCSPGEGCGYDQGQGRFRCSPLPPECEGAE